MLNPVAIISSLISYYKLFSFYVGPRLYLLVVLMFSTGIVDGIGLGLFLPLLNIEKSVEESDRITALTREFFHFLGIEAGIGSIVILILMVFLLKGCISFWQQYIIARLLFRLKKRLKLQMARQYALMDYRTFTGLNMGYLNNIITTEIDKFYAGFTYFCDLLVFSLHVLIYFAFTAALNCKMTAFVVLASLVTLSSLRFLSRHSATVSIRETKSNAEVQSLLIQGLHNYKYLKATHSFGVVLDKLREKLFAQAQSGMRLQVLGSIMSSVLEPLAVLYLCLLIFYQIYIEGGTLSEVFVLFAFFYRTFSRVFNVQVAWQKFSGKLGSIREVEKARSLFAEEREADGGCPLENEHDCDLVFDHVNFSYDKKQVLYDISLTVPENSSVAIVGASGAGKTTLFDLITGLLSPQSGNISCGAISYCAIDKASLRSRIGYVTQEPVIFDDTAANNISLWQYDPQNDASREQLKEAARLAHCAEFIADLENGFDSVIGEKGVKLSGGQRQRISIARELFKRPRIMIYDEATSSLDSESEQAVQRSIHEMKGTRTVIIIAHRLSTIRHCDYLYVLEKGRIVEEGTFQSLYDKEGGHFRRMCLAQQL